MVIRLRVVVEHHRRQNEPALKMKGGLDDINVCWSRWLGVGSGGLRRHPSGELSAMRQAALLSATSQKIQRMLEIVKEAEATGRRVTVQMHRLLSEEGVDGRSGA